MPDSTIKSIEEAEKEIVALSNSMKSHKTVIEEMSSIASRVIEKLNETSLHSADALENFQESTSSVESHKVAVVSAVNDLKVLVHSLTESNTRTVEQFRELLTSHAELKNDVSTNFSRTEAMLASLTDEVQSLKTVVEEKSLWSVFRRK